MAGKEFTFGFVLSASMNSSFVNSFAKSSKQVDELRQYMEKLRTESSRLKRAMDSGIITQKTFDTAVIDRNARSMQAWRQASAGIFRQTFADWNVLYYKATFFAGMFAKPIQASMQFESTMADVKKVVDFDTPQQFQQMNKEILALSTRIPMTASGLGQIVAAGGQSGIARDELTAFAESAAKMGVAFAITADQARDMMAKWRTAFRMGQDDVISLADQVNYLGNTTAASAPLISDVVTRIGPLGEVGGLASDEIAAMGASLVGIGIQADVAVTGIKNLILALVSGESATKSQAAAFEALAQRMQNHYRILQMGPGWVLSVIRKRIPCWTGRSRGYCIWRLDWDWSGIFYRCM